MKLEAGNGSSVGVGGGIQPSTAKSESELETIHNLVGHLQSEHILMSSQLVAGSFLPPGLVKQVAELSAVSKIHQKRLAGSESIVVDGRVYRSTVDVLHQLRADLCVGLPAVTAQFAQTVATTKDWAQQLASAKKVGMTTIEVEQLSSLLPVVLFSL